MKRGYTKEILTERLRLRRFRQDDAQSMYENWAGDPEVTKYLTWDAHQSVEVTRAVLKSWEEAYGSPGYCQWAIEMDGQPIGSIALVAVTERNQSVEVGYCLGRRWWGRGIMTEAAGAVMAFCFRELEPHKFIGCCDAENPASARVMEKLGMKREAVLRDHYLRRDGSWADIEYRAILKEEWELRRFLSLKCRFDGFYPLPELSDGEISLVCVRRDEADPVKKYVPAYKFHVMREGVRIGEVNLRVGYVEGLFYGGNVGYYIDEAFRGRGYAGRACRLLVPVLRLHGMDRAYITNSVANAASRRVCEKLGARHAAMVEVPEWNELRGKDETRFVNVYEWEV